MSFHLEEDLILRFTFANYFIKSFTTNSAFSDVSNDCFSPCFFFCDFNIHGPSIKTSELYKLSTLVPLESIARLLQFVWKKKEIWSEILGSEFSMVVITRTYTNSFNPKRSRSTTRIKGTIINDSITRKRTVQNSSLDSDT